MFERWGQMKIFASSSSWTKILENSAGNSKFSGYNEFHCLLQYIKVYLLKKKKKSISALVCQRKLVCKFCSVFPREERASIRSAITVGFSGHCLVVHHAEVNQEHWSGQQDSSIM